MTSPKHPAALDTRAGYLADLMPRLGKQMQKRITVPCKQKSMTKDLTPVQMAVLYCVKDHGPVSMRALADANRTTMPTTTEIVDRLVKVGLVARSQDERDRRVVRVAITPKGLAAFKAQQQIARKYFEELLASLTEADQQEFVAAMQAIERILLRTPAA